MKCNAGFGDTERIGKPESLLLRSEILFKFARFITARPITEIMVPEFNAINGVGLLEPSEKVGTI